MSSDINKTRFQHFSYLLAESSPVRLPETQVSPQRKSNVVVLVSQICGINVNWAVQVNWRPGQKTFALITAVYRTEGLQREEEERGVGGGDE